MNDRPQVLLCMPSRGDARIEAAQSHFALATRGKCDVIPVIGSSSLLAYGFNRMWATAINYAAAGAVTHFLLHHDDIEVRTPGWLDVMLAEMRRTGAAVLSVVQPIKDDSGLTSTAIGAESNRWLARKLSFREIARLPETFCAKDTRWSGSPLLANTGLMLVDLSRPEWLSTNPDGSLKFRFQITDRIVKGESGLWEAQFLPEDWAFSRDCWDAGLPVHVTNKVECHHWGSRAHTNRPVIAETEASGHYYQGIDGWFDFADVYRMAVERVPHGGSIVEVGCWKGKSLSFLLVEAKLSGKAITIHGVDHFKGSADKPSMVEEAGETDLFDECTKNVRRAGYPHWQLIRKPSLVAADDFADGSLDFVFIDGAHNFTSVRDDIRAWLPKVKPGGVLAGHDYDEPGVVDAVALCLPRAQPQGRCWWYDVPKIKEPIHAEVTH